MADQKLPEGTDIIIDDAAGAGIGDDLTTATGADADEASSAGTELATGPVPDAPTSGSGGVKGAFKTGSDKLRSTASDKAMGLFSQGLERSTGAMSHVSAIIGDTAANLDERLGSQYGDYARSAAQAIENAASSLSSKDPEELVDDARALVRKSPGIALAGAAILGFALVRVVKSGLESPGRDRA